MATGEAYHLKKTVLRMYWDNETEPSVETPIGDFFGLGLGTYTVFQSALVAVAPDKALNAYFPMPFARHARITVTNEGSQEITDFYWNVDWVSFPHLPRIPPIFMPSIGSARLVRAGFRETFTATISARLARIRAGANLGRRQLCIAGSSGNGHFVGVTFSVFQNQWGGWNEGDEMIWIDGEQEPRIHGTGGEDYFNGPGDSRLSTLFLWWASPISSVGARLSVLSLSLAPGSAPSLSQIDQGDD